MGFYAADGVVSTSPLDGGVEITETEYLAAVEGMAMGKQVSVDGGVLLIEFPPEPEPAPAPVPTEQEVIQAFQFATELHVDAVAAERGYMNGVSCASYKDSTHPEWAAEASAFIAWRDAVWVYAFQELDKVQNDLRPQPTIEEFIGELPVISWPAAS